MTDEERLKNLKREKEQLERAIRRLDKRIRLTREALELAAREQ